MKAECLPFSQIPHTIRLFADFLTYSADVQRFYHRSPHFREWLKLETPNHAYPSERRQRVADILERQNRAFGSSSKTHANISRFRNGACAAVTGQQVGLFGGPTFSLYKALTAVRLAEQAQAAGVDCVPIFWLATEDHDFEEVNHTFLFGPEGGLEIVEVSSSGPKDAPVGTVRFSAEIEKVVEVAANLLGAGELADILRETYRPGETLGSAFAKLFARLFGEWGVILLDAGDPEIDAIAEPLYRSAIERASELDEKLLERGQELESAGYHQQVKVTESTTLLFMFRDGVRVPVHRHGNGDGETQFKVGEEKLSRSKLLEKIASDPQNFSANVLLRPVVQDYVLPTLVYTGGSAEVAYFAQVAVVYQELLGHVTPIVPRFSATIIEAKSQRLMERYGLSIPDLFRAPDALRELLAARALPPDLQAAFDQAKSAIENSLSAIRASLERLDATLVDAAKNTEEKVSYQLGQLQARAARAELRQTEVLARHAEFLNNALYPSKALQERELAGVAFLARHQLNLLRDLYSLIHTDCLDHQVVRL